MKINYKLMPFIIASKKIKWGGEIGSIWQSRRTCTQNRDKSNKRYERLNNKMQKLLQGE